MLGKDSAGMALLRRKLTLLMPLQEKLLGITWPETPSPTIQNPFSPELFSSSHIETALLLLGDASLGFFYVIMSFTQLHN